MYKTINTSENNQKIPYEEYHVKRFSDSAAFGFYEIYDNSRIYIKIDLSNYSNNEKMNKVLYNLYILELKRDITLRLIKNYNCNPDVNNNSWFYDYANEDPYGYGLTQETNKLNIFVENNTYAVCSVKLDEITYDEHDVCVYPLDITELVCEALKNQQNYVTFTIILNSNKVPEKDKFDCIIGKMDIYSVNSKYSDGTVYDGSKVIGLFSIKNEINNLFDQIEISDKNYILYDMKNNKPFLKIKPYQTTRKFHPIVVDLTVNLEQNSGDNLIYQKDFTVEFTLDGKYLILIDYLGNKYKYVYSDVEKEYIVDIFDLGEMDFNEVYFNCESNSLILRKESYYTIVNGKSICKYIFTPNLKLLLLEENINNDIQIYERNNLGNVLSIKHYWKKEGAQYNQSIKEEVLFNYDGSNLLNQIHLVNEGRYIKFTRVDNKITEIKCVTSNNTYTLLHYIINYLDKKVSDVISKHEFTYHTYQNKRFFNFVSGKKEKVSYVKLGNRIDITDYLGNVSTVYYDSDANIIEVSNDLKNIKYANYIDKEGNVLSKQVNMENKGNIFGNDNLFEVGNCINSDSFVTKRIMKHGNANDEYSFILKGKAEFAIYSDFLVKIKFINEVTEDVYVFKFDKLTNDYQYLINSVKSNLMYDSIEMTVYVKNNTSASVEVIAFFKTNGSQYYNFNEKQEISNVESNNEDYTYSYENGNVNLVKSFSGDICRLSQDFYKQGDFEILTGREKRESSLDARLNPINVMSIDSNNYEHNVSYEYQDSKDLVKKIIDNDNITEYVYNDCGLVTEVYVNDNNKTTYSYDNLGRIISVTNYYYSNETNEYAPYSQENFNYTANTVQVLDPLDTNNTTVKYYDAFGRLLKIVQGTKVIVEYTYYDTSSEERSIIDYDVKVNNLLYKMYYNKNGQLIKKTLQKVGENTLKEYNYSYNQDKLLSIIYSVNGSEVLTTLFEYDDSNALVKVIEGNKITFLNSDNLEYLQQKIINYGNESFVTQYDNVNETQILSLKEYLKNLSYKTTNDFIYPSIDKTTFFDAEPILSGVEIEYDEKLNLNVFSFFNRNSGLSYRKYYTDTNIKCINHSRINKKYRNKNYDNEIFKDQFFYKNYVGGWFRLSTMLVYNVPLFDIQYSNGIRYGVYLDHECKLVVKYNGIDINFESSTNFSFDDCEWQFVEIYCVDSKLYVSLNEQHINFDIDNIERIIKQERIRIADVEDSLNVQFMDVLIGGYTQYYLPSNIRYLTKVDFAYISIGCDKLTNDYDRTILNEGKKIFENGRTNDSTNTLFYDSNVYKEFTLIPLNGSFDSSIKVNEFTDTSDYNVKDCNKYFKFDEEINRFVYNSAENQSIFGDVQKSNLNYNLNLPTKGLITMWVKPQKDGYLLSNVDVENKKVVWGAYLDSNFKIVIVNNLNFTTTVIGEETEQCLIPDEWNFVCFRWDTNKVKVKVNETEFVSINCNNTNLSNTITCFGNTIGDVTNLYKPTNQLTGLIELIAFKDETSSLTTMDSLNKLYQKGRPISFISKYDQSNRCKEDIVISNNKVLAHYYRYNNIDNKLNLLPHHEINYQNNRIKYTYDKYGQITEKVIINENNQQIEKYTYTYNSKNMLTNEYYEDDLDNGYTIHYTYDDAGNVVSVTKKDLNNVTIEHKSFAYSNNKLTTLTKNGLVKTFSYNTNDEPVSYGDNSLIWNEGKLSSFGNLSFEYDSNGRRTKKRIGNEQNVEYLYDDDKIIRSIKNNQKVDYLYDINDKLIGFKLLNNNYFYEREITGIITNIVDESGNSVVKYKYDGFGNLLSATGDNTIIDNNIFLYKGYCYDVETGLFWLSSRYYSPELCRFISPDDIEYLDPTSINGLNLYAYCMNDPIMYCDPSGHIPEWLSDVGRFIGGLLISAASVALMVATISSGGILCLVPGYGTFLEAELSLLMYGGFMMASSWDPLIQSDMEAINWNPFNSNPNMSKVNKVSFYKGEAVILQDFAPNSFSYGIMFLHKNEYTDQKTVKHEWGHFAQLTLHGPIIFTMFMALPSLLYNFYCSKTGDWSKYYDMPWEAYADYLGGVKR